MEQTLFAEVKLLSILHFTISYRLVFNEAPVSISLGMAENSCQEKTKLAKNKIVLNVFSTANRFFWIQCKLIIIDVEIIACKKSKLKWFENPLIDFFIKRSAQKGRDQ
jgi:hypothetical protein